jgi:hypothetical protein
MPLPVVCAGYAARCSARSRTTGNRCWNPAAFGMATCRYHGARRPQTVRKGQEHPQYQNGRETQPAKQQRSQALARIALYEEVLAQAGQLCGPRTRGPKPKERPAAKPGPKDQASSAAKPPARAKLCAERTVALPQGRKQMLARPDALMSKPYMAAKAEPRAPCAPKSLRSCVSLRA